jgi:hypothetical protein
VVTDPSHRHYTRGRFHSTLPSFIPLFCHLALPHTVAGRMTYAICLLGGTRCGMVRPTAMGPRGFSRGSCQEQYRAATVHGVIPVLASLRRAIIFKRLSFLSSVRADGMNY